MDRINHMIVWIPTEYAGPMLSGGWMTNQGVYHHSGNQRTSWYHGYNNKFVSWEIRSKPRWERTPTVTENILTLSLDFLPLTLFWSTGVSHLNNFERSALVIQVSSKPPRILKGIKMSPCANQWRKYQLSRRPKVISTRSGIAAPIDKAMTS